MRQPIAPGSGDRRPTGDPTNHSTVLPGSAHLLRQRHGREGHSAREVPGRTVLSDREVLRVLGLAAQKDLLTDHPREVHPVARPQLDLARKAGRCQRRSRFGTLSIDHSTRCNAFTLRHQTAGGSGPGVNTSITSWSAVTAETLYGPPPGACQGCTRPEPPPRSRTPTSRPSGPCPTGSRRRPAGGTRPAGGSHRPPRIGSRRTETVVASTASEMAAASLYVTDS